MRESTNHNVHAFLLRHHQHQNRETKEIVPSVVTCTRAVYLGVHIFPTTWDRETDTRTGVVLDSYAVGTEETSEMKQETHMCIE